MLSTYLVKYNVDRWIFKVIRVTCNELEQWRIDENKKKQFKKNGLEANDMNLTS